MLLFTLLSPTIKSQQVSRTGILYKALSNICGIVGHNWRYKDYTNWMKENGDDYDFKASRKCLMCHQVEYLFEDWKAENVRSHYDVKGDSHALKQLPHYPMA